MNNTEALLREALRELVSAANNALQAMCKSADMQSGAVDDFDEAITRAEAAALAHPPHHEQAIAYRVDWPAEAVVGLERFFGADDVERMSRTIATFGPAKIVPLCDCKAHRTPALLDEADARRLEPQGNLTERSGEGVQPPLPSLSVRRCGHPLGTTSWCPDCAWDGERHR